MPEQFRRTDPRYDRRLEVEIVVGEGKRQLAHTRNVSLGGMFVETDFLIPIGSTIQVRFKVPTQPEPVEVTGEVRWSERGTSDHLAGMGVRFHGLRARDVWALNRFFGS